MDWIMGTHFVVYEQAVLTLFGATVCIIVTALAFSGRNLHLLSKVGLLGCLLTAMMAWAMQARWLALPIAPPTPLIMAWGIFHLLNFLSVSVLAAGAVMQGPPPGKHQRVC
jgi:hypothetical protein